MSEHKRARLVEVKTPGDEPGQFKAVVSVFGNVDDGGDRVVKGAFADDLAATGGIYPIVWSHDWQTVPIGVTKAATETDRGLEIDGSLLIDDHPIAKQVYAAFKAGVPMEFSFGYDVTSSRFVEEDGKQIRELTGLKALEVGPCLVGMNRETELLSVKGAYASHTGGLIAAQDVAALLKSVIADAPTSEAPEAPSDPVDAGSSQNTDADGEGGPSALAGEQLATAVRYLATPVD